VKCAGCDGLTRVLETRAWSTGLTVYRRRQCESCSVRFTTVEVAKEVSVPKVARRVVPSRNDAEGFKRRAEARRRVEEMRDESLDAWTMDDLKKELGW